MRYRCGAFARYLDGGILARSVDRYLVTAGGTTVTTGVRQTGTIHGSDWPFAPLKMSPYPAELRPRMCRRVDARRDGPQCLSFPRSSTPPTRSRQPGFDGAQRITPLRDGVPVLSTLGSAARNANGPRGLNQGACRVQSVLPTTCGPWIPSRLPRRRRPSSRPQQLRASGLSRRH
jgi:hypothetical protein